MKNPKNLQAVSTEVHTFQHLGTITTQKELTPGVVLAIKGGHIYALTTRHGTPSLQASKIGELQSTFLLEPSSPAKPPRRIRKKPSRPQAEVDKQKAAVLAILKTAMAPYSLDEMLARLATHSAFKNDPDIPQALRIRVSNLKAKGLIKFAAGPVKKPHRYELTEKGLKNA